MSTTTTDFGLIKPGSGDLIVDPVSLAPDDLNDNFDVIDDEMTTGHHWSARDSGYVAWTADPGMYANGTLGFTSHTYFLSALRCHKASAFTKLGLVVTTAGTRTDLRFAVYGPTGTRLGTTGNVTGSVSGTGFKTVTLAGTAGPGLLYVVGWEIASVAMQLAASTVSNSGAGTAANDPTGGTAARRTGSVSDGGAGTDIPASLTVASGVVTSPVFASAATTNQFWCGLIA